MDCIHIPSASVAVLSADPELADAIARMLTGEQTQVSHYSPVTAEGEPTFDSRPDVFVIDREIAAAVESRIRRMRRRWPTIEIVVVNARGEKEVEALLDAGADDVIEASSPVLAARLHARARRARTVNAGARIAMGDVVFDRESRRVWCAGHEVEMTPKEHALLDCLFWYAPEPVGVSTISDFVWGDGLVARRRGLVEVYVGYLRRKLNVRGEPAPIETVRSVGYRLAGR
jgi:DNA-binding response OmpR family regulator